MKTVEEIKNVQRRRLVDSLRKVSELCEDSDNEAAIEKRIEALGEVFKSLAEVYKDNENTRNPQKKQPADPSNMFN